MRYDLYKLDDHDEPHLWRSDVGVNEVFRVFGFPRVKDKLRDLRHLEGTFLTAEMFLIPVGKPPIKTHWRKRSVGCFKSPDIGDVLKENYN